MSARRRAALGAFVILALVVVLILLRRSGTSPAGSGPGSSASTPAIVALPSPCAGELAQLSASPANALIKMPFLTGGALRQAILDHNQLAYVIATAEWETDHFNTMEEYYNSADDLNQAYDGEIGNGAYPSNDGFTYRGRGYVQLTGRANYQTMGTLLGIDLVGAPDQAEDPLVAGEIAAIGMHRGLFTGASLDDYITASSVDFVGARRIVNGQDKAETIAGYAENFTGTLASCNGGVLH